MRNVSLAAGAAAGLAGDPAGYAPGLRAEPLVLVELVVPVSLALAGLTIPAAGAVAGQTRVAVIAKATGQQARGADDNLPGPEAAAAGARVAGRSGPLAARSGGGAAIVNPPVSLERPVVRGHRLTADSASGREVKSVGDDRPRRGPVLAGVTVPACVQAGLGIRNGADESPLTA